LHYIVNKNKLHGFLFTVAELVTKIRSFSAGSTNVVSTFMCTTVDHYASTYGDKGWGCGYRNMQMLISSLLHHTGFNEQLYKPSLVHGGIYGLAVASYDQANSLAAPPLGVEMVSWNYLVTSTALTIKPTLG